jgi:hypothetical protein
MHEFITETALFSAKILALIWKSIPPAILKFRTVFVFVIGRLVDRKINYRLYFHLRSHACQQAMTSPICGPNGSAEESFLAVCGQLSSSTGSDALSRYL